MSVTGDSVRMENTANTTGATIYASALIPIEDLTDGKYFFSVDNVSYSPNNNYTVILVTGLLSTGNSGCGVGVNYSTGKWATYADFSTYHQGHSEYFQSGSYMVEAHISAPMADHPNTTWDAGYLSFSNLMLAKVSSENEKIGYEPYFIQRDTIFATPSDCTLTAVWSANSNNLLTNGNFEDVYTQTDTGWDNSINGTLHARDWGDYNRYLKNPSTAMHAHLKDISSTDPQHGRVFEMIRSQPEYVGIQYLYDNTTSITAGSYRLSFSIKGVSGLNLFRAALYMSKTGIGYDSCEYYPEAVFILPLETTDWFRVTRTFHITEITYVNGLYLYASNKYYIDEYPPSPNNIFYLDDVFFEKVR